MGKERRKDVSDDRVRKFNKGTGHTTVGGIGRESVIIFTGNEDIAELNITP